MRQSVILAVLLVAARVPAQDVAPASPTTAPAQVDLSTHIKQRLDQEVSLDLRDKTLADAFGEIEKRTGVPLKIDEDTLDRLPYGEQTKVNARIEGVTLREALAALLRPIGLTFQVRANEVGVYAIAPLRRLVRRATWEELDTLRRLQESAWSDELWKSLDVQYLDAGTDKDMNAQTLEQIARTVGAGTASEVLTYACNQKGWTWYPSGDKIVVLSKRRQLERQLSKRVTRKFIRTPISEVLLDLGREADVHIKLEPGAIASLPAQTAESFSLQIENYSVKQAFEVIAGTTGLGFFIDQDGVRFTASQISPETLAATGGDAAALAAIRANAVVGMVTRRGEGGAPDVTFFIRESDLPPELREVHKRKLEDAVNAFRRALGAERDTGVE